MSWPAYLFVEDHAPVTWQLKGRLNAVRTKQRPPRFCRYFVGWIPPPCSASLNFHEDTLQPRGPMDG